MPPSPSSIETSESIETKESWVVASVALFIMMMAFGAAWITAVGLKDIAAEAGGARSIPMSSANRSLRPVRRTSRR